MKKQKDQTLATALHSYILPWFETIQGVDTKVDLHIVDSFWVRLKDVSELLGCKFQLLQEHCTKHWGAKTEMVKLEGDRQFRSVVLLHVAYLKHLLTALSQSPKRTSIQQERFKLLAFTFSGVIKDLCGYYGRNLTQDEPAALAINPPSYHERDVLNLDSRPLSDLDVKYLMYAREMQRLNQSEYIQYLVHPDVTCGTKILFPDKGYEQMPLITFIQDSPVKTFTEDLRAAKLQIFNPPELPLEPRHSLFRGDFYMVHYPEKKAFHDQYQSIKTPPHVHLGAYDAEQVGTIRGVHHFDEDDTAETRDADTPAPRSTKSPTSSLV